MNIGNNDEPVDDESPTDELPVLTELDVVDLDAGRIELPPGAFAAEDDRLADDDTAYPLSPVERVATPEDLPEIEPLPESDEELAFLRRRIQLLEATLEDKDEEIASLAERLKATRDAVERRDQTETRLRAELAEAAAERRQLEARLAEAEALATQYASRVAELTSRVRTLEQEAAERDKVFADLEAELVAREARLVERERALAEAEAAAGAASSAIVAGADGVPYGTDRHVSDDESTFAAALAASREEAAALAAYIECRRAHWLALEAQLEEYRVRVRELEQELEQRAERERREAERADAEGRRAEALKAEIARMRERSEPGPSTVEPEQSAGDAPTTRLHTPEPKPASTGDGAAAPLHFTPAALVCLTSDPPRTYPIGSNPLVIGRGPDCDVRIATPFVSREHARIVREQSSIVIEDLGSRNGVYVNAVRVHRGTLQDGDLVTIGETQFRFECQAQDGPA